MNVFDRPKRKLFNVADPCNERDHYMLPALERLPEVVDLICDRQYFLIHAARQSGKTTALKYLTRCINQSSTQCALYCTLESVQQITDHDTALRAIAALILRTSAKARLISLDDVDGKINPACNFKWEKKPVEVTFDFGEEREIGGLVNWISGYEYQKNFRRRVCRQGF